MWEVVLTRVLIPLACAAVSFGVGVLVKWLKSKTDNVKLKSALDKFQKTVEDIAITVEQLFDGANSSDKLYAFKDICVKKGLNVEDAVNYLENHIIPTSKAVNIVEVIDGEEVLTD